jgi:hypothetical protein
MPTAMQRKGVRAEGGSGGGPAADDVVMEGGAPGADGGPGAAPGVGWWERGHDQCRDGVFIVF